LLISVDRAPYPLKTMRVGSVYGRDLRGFAQDPSKKDRTGAKIECLSRPRYGCHRSDCRKRATGAKPASPLRTGFLGRAARRLGREGTTATDYSD
jgi:hypothetical protein